MTEYSPVKDFSSLFDWVFQETDTQLTRMRDVLTSTVQAETPGQRLARAMGITGGDDDAERDARYAAEREARRGGGIASQAPAPAPGRPGTFPVPQGRIISEFGDARDGGARRHQGIDIGAPHGTRVDAFRGGTVTKVYTGERSGLSVQVRGDDGRLYNYFHLSKTSVRAGQRVGQGSQLGSVGNTGNARNTPPHLHFEVRESNGTPIDPRRALFG